MTSLLSSRSVFLAAALAATVPASAQVINLALNKPVSVTSEVYGTLGSQAVDGIGIGGSNYPAIWHSGGDFFPAITIDLGAVYLLGDETAGDPADVVLSNRTDCCQDRLTRIRLEVFDAAGTSGAPLFTGNYLQDGSFAGDTYNIELPVVSGQFVRLTKLNDLNSPADDSRSLNIAEIQVFGVPEPASLGLLGLAGAGFLLRRRR